MKKFGLIGSPIRNSLSPKLFEAAYGGKYPYELIEEEDFASAFSIFIEEYEAVNITAPFKHDAYNAADILSRECEITKAANILIKKDGQIHAYNSDVKGVIHCLLKCEQCKQALIVGCGGAGRAAAYAALLLGMDIGLINRTYENAIEFKNKLLQTAEGQSAKIEVYHFENLIEVVEKNCIIIYTLPPIEPHNNSYNSQETQILKELSNLDLQGKKFIIEANYTKPFFSKLDTGNNDCSGYQSSNEIIYISGKEWLLGQAIAGYKIMTQEKPNISAMLKVL